MCKGFGKRGEIAQVGRPAPAGAAEGAPPKKPAGPSDYRTAPHPGLRRYQSSSTSRLCPSTSPVVALISYSYS